MHSKRFIPDGRLNWWGGVRFGFDDGSSFLGAGFWWEGGFLGWRFDKSGFCGERFFKLFWCWRLDFLCGAFD